MNNNDTIISALRLLYQPGDVFEVRVLDAQRPGYRRPHVESGYFDYEHIETVHDALAEITAARGVYVTLNPVNPALLARAANRIRPVGPEPTTGDADIQVRRWLPVDCDPVRPAGISATDAEHELAVAKATEIRDGMATLGWPEPVAIDSGNGGQLLYRIDLPVDDGGLVHQCLKALAAAGDDRVQIDQAVHNPARIWRLPGTWNRKGDDVPERPHRLAKVLSAPDAPLSAPRALLERLAQPSAPVAGAAHTAPCAPVSATGGRPGDDFNQRGELEPVLEAHGWQRVGQTGDNQLWRRPGKASGSHSATFDGQCFYVFSSAAAPFEANRGYSKFQVLAMLDHGGDFAAAARALAAQGYGDGRPDEAPDVDISGIVGRFTGASHDPPTGEPPPGPAGGGPCDPGPLPEDLLQVPGFIGQVMEHTLATAPYPNRVLAFCGALCLQSYLAARRVRDQLNNRSNLYIVALANSGVGKDHPRQVNSEIAYLAGALRGVGDAFASGEGIEDAMFLHQSMLFQTDEIDAILGNINRARDGRNEMIMQILLKMYGSSRTRYPLRKRAGQTEPLVIQQPSLTLFGTAVPQYFYKALSGRMLNNGLFARTLVLDAGPRSRGRTPAMVPVPQPIIDIATWWANFNPGGVTSGNLSGFHPDPVVVPDTPEASARGEAIWTLTDDAYEEAQRQGDETRMAIWARSYEKVRKLALLYACSENHDKPQITVAGIDWGWRTVQHQTRRMLYMADLYVADSEFEADCKRFIEVLTKWQERHGTEFMAHWLLSRAVAWAEKKIEEVRDSLVAQELIEVQMPQRGPMKPQYRLRG